MSARERIIVVMTVLAPLTIVAGATESVVAFSTLISLIIGLGFGLAYADYLRDWRVSLTLIVVYGGLVALWAAAHHLHDPEGPLTSVLGLPIQTTIFVWVIWPLGATMAVLHVAVFDQHLLPQSSVDRVLAHKKER